MRHFLWPFIGSRVRSPAPETMTTDQHGANGDIGRLVRAKSRLISCGVKTISLVDRYRGCRSKKQKNKNLFKDQNKLNFLDFTDE